MKTSEKIKYATDRGYHVVVKDNRNNDYTVVSKFHGSYRRSIWSKSLKGTKESLAYWGDESSEKFDNPNYTIHEIFMLPYKSYEVGEKVIYKGEVYTIFWVNKYGTYDLTRELSGVGCVQHKDLLPYFEEQDDKTKEAIEYLQKGGYKIIKE